MSAGFISALQQALADLAQEWRVRGSDTLRHTITTSSTDGGGAAVVSERVVLEMTVFLESRPLGMSLMYVGVMDEAEVFQSGKVRVGGLSIQTEDATLHSGMKALGDAFLLAEETRVRALFTGAQ